MRIMMIERGLGADNELREWSTEHSKNWESDPLNTVTENSQFLSSTLTFSRSTALHICNRTTPILFNFFFSLTLSLFLDKTCQRVKALNLDWGVVVQTLPWAVTFPSLSFVSGFSSVCWRWYLQEMTVLVTIPVQISVPFIISLFSCLYLCPTCLLINPVPNGCVWVRAFLKWVLENCMKLGGITAGCLRRDMAIEMVCLATFKSVKHMGYENTTRDMEISTRQLHTKCLILAKGKS